MRGSVRSGQGGFDVQDAVHASTTAGTVGTGSTGVQDGAHVPVLNRQRDQPARAAGNVPGQSPSEPCHPDGSVRIFRDDLVRQVMGLRLVVRPRGEGFNPLIQG